MQTRPQILTAGEMAFFPSISTITTCWLPLATIWPNCQKLLPGWTKKSYFGSTKLFIWSDSFLGNC